MPRLHDDAAPPEFSVPPSRFDALFAEKSDPWDLAVKWHDRRKFAVTTAVLPRERYRRCFEPGCANGDLTLLLAQRCDEVLAVDCAAQAVDQARLKVADHPHVRVEVAILPQQAPAGQFDLVVVSELLYYMSADDRDVTVKMAFDVLESGGDLVAVHWRSSDRCYGYDGYNAHSAIRRICGTDPLLHLDDENFLLDVFRKPPTPGGGERST